MANSGRVNYGRPAFADHRVRGVSMIKDVAGRVISGIVSALAIWTFNEFATPSMKAHLWSFITNFFPIGVGLVAALIWWIITTIRRAGTLAEKVTRLEATIRATGASGDNEIVYRDPAARRGWGAFELIN